MPSDEATKGVAEMATLHLELETIDPGGDATTIISAEPDAESAQKTRRLWLYQIHVGENFYRNVASLLEYHALRNGYISNSKSFNSRYL